MTTTEQNNAQKNIREQLLDSARTLTALGDQAGLLEAMSKVLIEAYRRGNKIMVFGNGGSSCDAQHFAAELVGRFRRNRPALSALALVNTADLTCISNDFGFETIFARQLEAHAKPGDIAIAISTSGNSPNVLKALESAKKLGLTTLGLTGKAGGKMSPLVDHCLCAPSSKVARIQECHITAIHVLCDIVEEALFPDAPKAH